jgi:HK97 gp10 family phage protein
MTFDWASFERAGIEAAVGAMSRGAERVAGRAKDKAPVRRVFKGQDEAVGYRLKSIASIERDRSIRQRLGLGPEGTHLFPPLTVSRRAPQLLHLRAVPVNADLLSRRGRYEAKSGRAIHKGELGGRLRDEIEAIRASLDGRMIRSRVISPTPYSKFVEFGTRHNAAHPYLRPAGHESVSETKTDVAVSVVQAARAAASGRTERVVVKSTLMVEVV